MIRASRDPRLLCRGTRPWSQRQGANLRPIAGEDLGGELAAGDCERLRADFRTELQAEIQQTQQHGVFVGGGEEAFIQ